MAILNRMGGIGRAFSNRMADIAANRMDELGMGAPPQEVYPIASVMSQRSMGPLPGSLDWQLYPPEMSQKPGSGHAEALHMVGTGSMGGPRGGGVLEGAFMNTPTGQQIAGNITELDTKQYLAGLSMKAEGQRTGNQELVDQGEFAASHTWTGAWEKGVNDFAQGTDWMTQLGMGY